MTYMYNEYREETRPIEYIGVTGGNQYYQMSHAINQFSFIVQQINLCSDWMITFQEGQ